MELSRRVFVAAVRRDPGQPAQVFRKMLSAAKLGNEQCLTTPAVEMKA
jgi:hypothetical protein